MSSNLKQAFAQLLYEQKLDELSGSIMKRQQSNLRLVTLRFEGGMENKGNQLYQAATYSQAKYQYAHASRQKRAAVNQLAALLGRPGADNLIVAGDFNLPDPKVGDLRKLVPKHPSFLQAYYQRVAADEGIRIANQGWYPNVSLNAFVGKSGTEFFPQNNRWSVGVSIAFPFFPGTSQIFTSENAYAVFRQAEYTESSTANKLLAGIEQAYGNLVDAIEQVKVSQEFNDAAKARSVIATEKYNAGLMTFEDWTVIETDLINRAQTLLQNQLSAVQALIAWENALGISDMG